MNLRDLDLVSTSNGTVLYATNGSTGGVVNFSVNASTGALSHRDAITLPHLASVDGSVHLEQTRFGVRTISLILDVTQTALRLFG
jgi:hypothetical protein